MGNKELLRQDGKPLSEKEWKLIRSSAEKRTMDINNIDKGFNITRKIGLPIEDYPTDVELFRKYLSQISLGNEIMQRREDSGKLDTVLGSFFAHSRVEALNFSALNFLRTLRTYLENDTNEFIQQNYINNEDRAMTIHRAVLEFCDINTSANPWDVTQTEHKEKKDSWYAKWNAIFISRSGQ